MKYYTSSNITIIANMGEDVSAATAVSMRVKTPGGTITNWGAVADGTTITYTTETTDIPVPGNYVIQPVFTLGGKLRRGQQFVLPLDKAL